MRIAQLDSENRDRHIAVAELAERLGNHAAATRGYLRAGQLSTQNDDEALEFFAKAHQIAPNDRSTCLLYAQAQLRKENAVAAAALLAPLSETEKDATFLETYAEALMRLRPAGCCPHDPGAHDKFRGRFIGKILLASH